MERRGKKRKALKRGEVGEVGQEQSSVYRVRRRLDGEVEPIKVAKKWKTYRVNRIGRPL
jgi:hypothetical protein